MSNPDIDALVAAHARLAVLVNETKKRADKERGSL
jgi:hypothetical protein